MNIYMHSNKKYKLKLLLTLEINCASTIQITLFNPRVIGWRFSLLAAFFLMMYDSFIHTNSHGAVLPRGQLFGANAAYSTL